LKKCNNDHNKALTMLLGDEINGSLKIFQRACTSKHVTVDLLERLNKCWGRGFFFTSSEGRILPIQQLYEAKPSFEVTNYLFNSDIMNGINKEHQQVFNLFLDYQKKLLGKEVIAAAKAGGCVPIRRGRISFLGQSQGGTTSTIKALINEQFEAACKSTAGISMSNDVNVRDIRIDVTDGIVSEEGSEDWMKVDVKVKDKDGAIGTQILKDRSIFVGEPISKSAMEKILRKYKLGRDLVVKDEDLKIYEKREDEVRRQQEVRGEIPTFQNDAALNQEQVLDDIQQEPDIITPQYDDMDKKLLLSVWDYGGQSVLEIIQHLFFIRNSCYVVVVNLLDLIDNNCQKNALEDLQRWLSFIEVNAASDGVVERESTSLRYPPVVLVGTHFDCIKKKNNDSAKVLKEIDNILINGLGPSKVLQRDTDSLIKSREFLYNRKESLCFWPVDNSDTNDKNIKVLRHILVEGSLSDPKDYIYDPVPISWLNCIDDLKKLSEEEPVIPIEAYKASAVSIISVMKKWKAFQDIPSGTKYETACKRRAVAFLQYFHQLGDIIYFDEVKGFSIIDSQWLLDTISYIIRDFKFHRFRRDHRAMKLNDGTSWKNLLTKGILDVPLLKKLWLGQNENFGFLITVMIKLGVFAELLQPKLEGGIVYFVPNVVIVPFDVGTFSDSKIADYLQIDSIDKASTISFKFKNFLPIGFFNRLLTLLVATWTRPSNADMNSAPDLLPNACLMNMGSEVFVLVLNTTVKSIDLLTKSDPIGSNIMPHVINAMNLINKGIYKGNLVYDVPKVENVDLLGIIPIYRQVSDSRHIPSTQSEVHCDNTESLKNFLMTYANVEGKKAEMIAEKLIKSDELLTVKELKYQFKDVNEKEFRDEILKDEFGVGKKTERNIIIRALKNNLELPPKVDYLIGYFGGDKLHELEIEKQSLVKLLARANAGADIHSTGVIEVLRKALVNEFKVMHLAMHGAISPNNEKIHSLDFKDDFGVIVDPGILSKTIAGCCKCESDVGGGNSIECVFLNACYSSGIAKLLTEKYHVPWVVSWDTLVHDLAARNFAESFYYYLGSSEANLSCFDKAYEYAKNDIEFRGWFLSDPINREELFEEQRKRNSLQIKSAGIPRFFSKLVSNYKKQEPERLVQTLRELHLGAVMQVDKNGCPPLLECKTSEEMVQVLLEAHPGAAKEAGMAKMLSLHQAIMKEMPEESVLALLEGHPGAAREVDENMRLPLHYAAAYKGSEKVVLALIEEYPGASEEADEDKRLPLHYATANKASEKVVQALLKVHPGGAKMADKYEKLPLHHAAKNEAVEEVVNELLKVYPGAAKVAVRNKILPLHYAAMEQASVEVVWALLEVYPDAVKEVSENKMLPLHHAATHRASFKVVRALLKAHPGAVKVANKFKMLPLHHATLNKATDEVVQVLLEAYPGATKEADENKRLPLHYAAANKASKEVVRALLEAHPGAAKEEDKFKMLPLHHATVNKALEEVVQLLL